jgi:glycosyltransferase involved in cell wall biosynthesis
VAFGDRPYEVHILGAGEPHPIVAGVLNQPNVIWRGFVDRIDEEIRDCDVFLCTNNATEYKVTHTRYLHAWSLGAPVLAHRDASLSMPEIVHERNAMLGGSSREFAEYARRIVDDAGLRVRLSKEGMRTFEEQFTADKVAAKILAALRDWLARH